MLKLFYIYKYLHRIKLSFFLYHELQPYIGHVGCLHIQHFFLKCHKFEIIVLFAPTFLRYLPAYLRMWHIAFGKLLKLFFCQIHWFYALSWSVKTPHVPNDARVTGIAIILFFTILNITCVKFYVIHV